MKKTLITVSGPTGVGKTKFAIKLASFLKCEIISSDSRQFYKELSIGTAVPSKNELDEVLNILVITVSLDGILFNLKVIVCELTEIIINSKDPFFITSFVCNV